MQKLNRFQRFQLLFHRDFDGICSAAVFLEYSQRQSLIGASDIELIPVDYDIRNTWESHALSTPTVIVDFLYHPKAEWWFDHHPTTFIRADWEGTFRPDDQHVWGPGYKSCPRLIIDSIADGRVRSYLSEYFREYIIWSDIIDAAEYASPQQVVESKEPALQVNLTLAVDTTPAYLRLLVTRFQRMSLSQLADSKEVRTRFSKAMIWQQEAISQMREVGELENGVAFFDLTSNAGAFHRYAAYYLWPEANFTIAVYRNGEGFKITVSANPWLRFSGLDVGLVCERYGGGGHRQIGGILVPDKGSALRIGREIAQITRGEAHRAQHMAYPRQTAKQSQ